MFYWCKWVSVRFMFALKVYTYAWEKEYKTFFSINTKSHVDKTEFLSHYGAIYHPRKYFSYFYVTSKLFFDIINQILSCNEQQTLILSMQKCLSADVTLTDHPKSFQFSSLLHFYYFKKSVFLILYMMFFGLKSRTTCCKTALNWISFSIH